MDSEILKETIETILGEIGERPVVGDHYRGGGRNSDVKTPRPIKFSFSNSDHVQQVLRSARRLDSKGGYRSVYICYDRTADERTAYKKLIEQLREKTTEPNRIDFIRNKKIGSFDQNSNREDQTGRK